MKRLRAFPAIYGGVIFSAALLSGCNVRTVRVDDHEFHVPKEYMVQDAIPRLPTSQREGLRFIVNPNARVEEQLIVGIESTAKTCHPASPPASSQLGSVCLAVAQKGADAEEQKFILQKTIRNGDLTQWEYQVSAGSGRDAGRVVASCFGLSFDGKSSGLCTSLGKYKDLIYVIGLRDVDIKKLQIIQAKVGGLLTSWEGRGQCPILSLRDLYGCPSAPSEVDRTHERYRPAP